MGTEKSNGAARIALISAASAVVVASITAFASIRSLESNVKEATTELTAAREEAAVYEERLSLPIGTIITSLLEPSKFAKQAGDPATFDQEFSKWVPADGLNVITLSKYGKAFSRQTTPDLRGAFLRGLNQFDPSKPPRSDEFADPDGDREPGSPQKDEFGSHDHAGTYRVFYPKGGGASADHKNLMAYGGVADYDFTLAANGGAESRPKNVAVYYYIRVN